MSHISAATLKDVNSLSSERQHASFPIRMLTYYMDGGEEQTYLREKIMTEFERDPEMQVGDFYDLPRSQIRERIMKRASVFRYYLLTDSVTVFRTRLNILSMLDPGFMTRLGVHLALFIGAITSNGNEEQKSYWLSKGPVQFGVFGCFAMTELGHGSNVAGLETTATFDPASDEFIIHSPTLTSMKFWIGGAAETATHSVVYAQMWVQGKCYGVKNFVVQLRDTKTFNLLPGVSIGDCGPKMGRNGIDNGWIQFTQVRIPRSHLLMKYTQVNREGVVTEPPIAQLAYGALIQGRVSMIKESADISKKAVTIAARYSCIRRQFALRPDAPETKIMDYQTHQNRLFPVLASAFAMHFGSVEVYRIYDELMAKLEVAKLGDLSMQDAIESLKETHATSAGLKAYCTWSAVDAIEICRQCLGGNGYSSYAGLASMYQDYVVQCTWEGDNTVLTLQAGRYLISCYKDLKTGKIFPQGVNYINRGAELQSLACKSKTIGLDEISEGFDVVRYKILLSLGSKFEDLISRKGLNEESAYDECSIPRFNAAKIHTIGYLFQRFYDSVKKSPKEIQGVLSKLCLLFGLLKVQEQSGKFLQYGYFQSYHMEIIEDQILGLYHELRDQIIPLVDSFNLSDFILNSPFGRYDGDVYRRFFEHVISNNPPKKPAYFETILKPLFEQQQISADRLELEEDEITAKL